MTKIFYISIPNKIKSKKIPHCKKLWYDIGQKKMIEVDGDLSFSYNYKESTLTVSGKYNSPSKVSNLLNNNSSILDQLKIDFDIEVLSKSTSQNNIDITLEISGDYIEFQEALDYHGLRYST